jgi:hypothetical protein
MFICMSFIKFGNSSVIIYSMFCPLLSLLIKHLGPLSGVPQVSLAAICHPRVLLEVSPRTLYIYTRRILQPNCYRCKNSDSSYFLFFHLPRILYQNKIFLGSQQSNYNWTPTTDGWPWVGIMVEEQTSLPLSFPLPPSCGPCLFTRFFKWW